MERCAVAVLGRGVAVSNGVNVAAKVGVCVSVAVGSGCNELQAASNMPLNKIMRASMWRIVSVDLDSELRVYLL